VAVASAELYASLHLAPDRQPCQHATTQFFTGRMPFLPPNQQRQSNEGQWFVMSAKETKKDTTHKSRPGNCGLTRQIARPCGTVNSISEINWARRAKICRRAHWTVYSQNVPLPKLSHFCKSKVPSRTISLPRSALYI